MGRLRRRRWLLAGISAAVALVSAEVALRCGGGRPGFAPRYSDFRPVEHLTVVDMFVADAEGTFKANPTHRWPEDVVLNADGFRSPPFEIVPTEAKTLLFLGDSFTWGASAEPVTRCFVDLLRDKGFTCHNTGIPGTDPGQYAALAEKWAPRLRPDVLVTMIYMGNDVNVDLSPRQPGGRVFWITNAGWLCGHDQAGNYFATAAAAYQYFLQQANLVEASDRGVVANALRSALATTVLGSRLWATLAGPAAGTGTCRPRSRDERKVALRACVNRIRAVADTLCARHLLVLIPVRPALRCSSTAIDTNADLFAGFDPHAPIGFETTDYATPPNDHLNNRGHQKMADYLFAMLHS